jgi:hypothetical protein
MVVRRDLITLDPRRGGMAGLVEPVASLRRWPGRRWLRAVGAATLFAVAAGLPTDVIPNPLAHREVPAAWWSYPTLAAMALLGGMLAATYACTRADRNPTGRSVGGGLLSLLAIGLPGLQQTGRAAGRHLRCAESVGAATAATGHRVDCAAGLGATSQTRRRAVLPPPQIAIANPGNAGGSRNG